MRRAPLIGLIALGAMACGGQTVMVSARGPIAYTAPVDASLRRFIVAVTVENRGSGSVVVSATSFQARDTSGRIYRADANATVADAQLIRLTASRSGIGVGPLPTVTLQSGDSVSGLVVFEVPAGTRLSQVEFRADDRHYTVDLETPPS